MTDSENRGRISRRRLLAGGAAAALAAAGGTAGARLLLRDGDGESAAARLDATATRSSGRESASAPSTSPTPIPGPQLVEETAGQWVVRSFARGEPIDLDPGICFMAPDGRVAGYQFTPSVGAPGGTSYRTGDDNRWVAVESLEGSGLYDRERDRGFSYPTPPLAVRLLSRDYVVFAASAEFHGQRWPPDPAGPYLVVDEQFRQVATFDLPDLGDRSRLRQWKRGPASAAIVADEQAVMRLDLATGEVERLHALQGKAGFDAYLERILWQPGSSPAVHYVHVPADKWDDDGRPVPGKSVISEFVVLDDNARAVESVRDWPGWGPQPSPDGNLVAYETLLHEGRSVLGAFSDRWPVTTVAAKDGEPFFRVRSLALRTGDFVDDNRWLRDSSGIIGATLSPSQPQPGRWPEYEHVVLSRDASMTALPNLANASGHWFRTSRQTAPVPSPGDLDLLSYGRAALYRRSTREFVAPEIPEHGPLHLEPWGNGSAPEMRFAFSHGGHDIGGPGGLLPPKVEFPPFDDSLRVRVAATAGCLDLRESPAAAASLITCLPDGTLLTLEPEPGDFVGEEPGRAYGGAIGHYNWEDEERYARVVTGDGQAGWVPIEYLEWA